MQLDNLLRGCMQGFDNILDRINDYQAEKEAKAAKAKEETERRQLQECSFAPEINRQPVKAKVCGSSAPAEATCVAV